MKRLKNTLIDKINKMTDEQLLSTNAAIDNLLKQPEKTRRIDTCPYCGGRTVKNGTQCGRQRYQCKSCNTTFTCTVNTVLYRSRSGEAIWKEVISDTAGFVSIDNTSERLGLTHDCVFHMRHKILAALEGAEAASPTKLPDVSECDETFVLDSLKGSKIPDDYWRKAREHGAKAQKRGVSNEYVCVCTGIGRGGDAVAISVNRAKPDASELIAAFRGHLDEGALVICDGHRPYYTLGIEYGCSVKDANKESDAFFHLNNVNGFHSFIKQKYEQYRGVATKYLNRYNVLFARAYRTGKTWIEGLQTMLCVDNTRNNYFSSILLKTSNLLAL